MSNVETQKILKHVCTRWLSLGNCLHRLIANWSPLLNFFEQEVAQRESSSAKSIRLESYKIPKKVTATAGKSESGSSKCMTSTSSAVQPATEKKLTAPSSQPVQKQLTFSSKLVHSTGETTDSAGCKKSKSASFTPTISKSHRKRSSSSRFEAEKGQTNKARMDKTDSSEPREERVLKSLLDSTNLAYANFLRAVVPIFEETNKVLQGENPLIHRLQRMFVGLLRNIQGRFILPSELAKSSSDPLSLDYRSRKNQKENAELFIGNGTADIVHDLPSEAQQNFYDSVRRYYCNACDCITAKFPVRPSKPGDHMKQKDSSLPSFTQADVLKHAEVSDTTRASESSWSDLKFFINKRPACVLRKEGNENFNSSVDELQCQWLDWQQYSHPLPSDIAAEEREDKRWVMVGKEVSLGQPRFDRLSHFMLSVLCIPHSNAACERLFSQVRKNKTDFRGSMTSQTPNCMLIAKGSLVGACHTQSFSKDLLLKAKSATANMVKKKNETVTSETAETESL